MNWFFAPARAVLARANNAAKLLIAGILFSIPLATALLAHPPVWTSGPGILIAASFLLACYFLVAMHSGTDESWAEITQIADQLSRHDLRAAGHRFADQNDGGGQYGFLLTTLADTQASLREMVSQARHSADAARTAADEMAAGNTNLSQRTEQQASTLEETASGMEELAATVKQNADNCRLASELATNASGIAQKGADLVYKVVSTMELIDRSSKKIVDIISVIESIAFQTNILALNAAVEAARAGEQGRGFAVVAGEVRNLAQRSADAAKEIKGLIGDSVEKVDQGAKLVKDAGHSINDVVVSVQQVTELITEIAVASREQSSGVEEMNRALIQLEGVTQQNAALVEQATASAMTFQDEASRLFDLVNHFQLDDADDIPAPAARASAPARAGPERESEAAGSAAAPGLAYKRKAGKNDPDDEWQEF